MEERDVPHADALPAGFMLAGYRILRPLGRGDVGFVYEAENPTTRGKSAIKEFFPRGRVSRDRDGTVTHSRSDAGAIAEGLRSFEQTAIALSRLAHPNIVRVFDVLPANETGYMVMERLDGRTLSDWLASHPSPPRLAELRSLLLPVMEALICAHGEGVVHRDIAPDRIFLTREGRPVLIGFGATGRDLRRRDTIDIRCHAFRAPEEWRNGYVPSPLADVYSMGAVLYNATTGDLPVDGESRQVELFLDQADPYRPLTGRLPAGCPLSAAQVIDQALTLSPQDRPRSMAEMCEAVWTPARTTQAPRPGRMPESAPAVGELVDGALPAGVRIAGYEIRRVLGRGGFAIVYEAENCVTRERVAIKELFPVALVSRNGQSLSGSGAHAETIAWALDQFERSATTLHVLRHPNIVKVHGYVPANETGYIILELLEGTTLLDWLNARPGPPSLDEVRPLVMPVMDALRHIHGRGMIHRDVAPGSIMVTRQGRPVLINLFSASSDLTEAAESEGVVGLARPHYTAPEQIRAKSRPTPQADVYSMGATLYRLLTGSEPADGQDRLDRLFRGEADPYQSLMSRRPVTCPVRAAAAIDKALEVRPHKRPYSMTELQEALEA